MPIAVEPLCTFTVAGMSLGIAVREVQEVMLAQRITRVPTAPALVRGLINLRGQIVTAIDLRQRLGLPPADDSAEPLNVVVRANGDAVSLLVDDIGEVVEVARRGNGYEPPPSTVPRSLRDLLLGVVPLEGRLLMVLDPARVLDLHDLAAPPR